MNFLSPWYLLGAALIAGPIIFHLIRRSTRDRIEFSATEFLAESPPRLERRSAVQNPWLLLLRCLVIFLLAASFARPLFRSESATPAAQNPSRSLALVIDQSASMGRPEVWEETLETARNIVAERDPNDSLALIGVADSPTELIDADEWGRVLTGDRDTLFAARLEALSPTARNAHLDTGIVAAMESFELNAEMAEESQSRIQEIHLLSDLASEGRISELAGREWPSQTRLEIHAIAPDNTRNLGLAWIGWAGLETEQASARFVIRSSPGSPDATLQLQLYDAPSATPIAQAKSVFVPSGTAQLSAIEIPPEQDGPFRLSFANDDPQFDNTLYFALPQTRKLDVIYHGQADTSDPQEASFYIAKAVNAWSKPESRFLSATNAAKSSANRKLHILSEPLISQARSQLRDAIENGDTALLLLSNPDLLSESAALSGQTGWEAATPQRNDALLGSIAFESPYFNLFAEPRYSDFSKIRFWQYTPFRIPDSDTIETLARFDDGSQAIAAARIGKGQLVVWGSNWTPDSSQWPLSSKFAPWLQNLAQHTLGGAAAPQNITFDQLRNPSFERAKWTDLEGQALQTEQPQAPGLYLHATDNGDPQVVAINIPPQETNLAPLDPDAWTQLGVPLEQASMQAVPAQTTPPSALEQSDNETESSQNAWRWVLLATLAILALESLIARIASIRQNQPAPS